MKKVILVHRWEGKPDSDWYTSISQSLKESGYIVEIPEMPDTAEPQIEPWVDKIKELVLRPDMELHFIGHSIGCQAILRYLESLPGSVNVGKIVFVAPWFNLQNLDVESQNIAKPWIENLIDLESVKKHISNITVIFSDNDPWVSLSDRDIFRNLLDAKVIVEHEKGHFTSEDGVINFPLVVNEFVEET